MDKKYCCIHEEKLDKENKDLKMTVAEKNKRIAQLETKCSDCQVWQSNIEISARNAELKAEIARLTSKLHELQNAVIKSKKDFLGKLVGGIPEMPGKPPGEPPAPKPESPCPKCKKFGRCHDWRNCEKYTVYFKQRFGSAKGEPPARGSCDDCASEPGCENGKCGVGSWCPDYKKRVEGE